MNQDASTEVRESTSTFATLRWVALAAVIVATVAGAFYYWRHSELYPTTENAYTGSNIVRVASEVSGPVIRVYVRTDEPVKTGDPLFDIDPTLYDAALRNARAQFDAAADAAGTAGDSLKKAAATLEEKRTALEDALQDLSRRQGCARRRTRRRPSSSPPPRRAGRTRSRPTRTPRPPSPPSRTSR